MGDGRRTALITGASSGIGEAFAEVLASHGFDLVITARREDRLRAVAERIGRDRGVTVTVIPGDLALPDGAATLGAEIDRRGIVVDALVNNAGYGVPGGYTRSSWERRCSPYRPRELRRVRLRRLLRSRSRADSSTATSS